MELDQALTLIHQTSWQNQTPTLERMAILLEKLGNPHKSLQFVHVAGTNGKGSTCACIASILQAAGYCVGLNTSPYIHRFNERIQVNGQEISDDAVCKTVQLLHPIVENLPFRPTEFEWITALALVHFQAQQCDIVVLEVGLGGALDASNVIDCPAVAVITALGLDHTAILGNTLAQVATAKAGIIKAGGTVVSYGGCPEGDVVIKTRCHDQGAILQVMDNSRLKPVESSLISPKIELLPYGILSLGLAGAYQPYNALLAVTAVEALVKQGWHITLDHIRTGLASVRWMGRFEVLSNAPVVILDGAHNPQGMAAVAQSVALYLDGNPTVVLGVLEDKDVGRMLQMLADFAGQVFTVTPPSPRAMTAEHLAAKLADMGVKATPCETVGGAMKRAIATEKPVLALGSLYLCDQVRQAMGK
ncbi:folylpolyglutamate synthase/dihydrofolate synthase family protein [Bengtsoniella intestinalis]|uniref:bifunctional folylpolyglutamate synthase/dihydrofolate synthase n=1 Tax=Bengtsoniella intestinalis TaxID=3073143 RepID=UPI00391F7D86